MNKDQISNDPELRQLMAHEPENDIEIMNQFRAIPSVLVIKTPTRLIWRHEFMEGKQDKRATCSL